MPAPTRTGIDPQRWRRRVARHDRARTAALRRRADLTDAGGIVVLWCRDALHRIGERTLLIQPGVADDLPSLLSSLAAELAWPGAPAEPDATCAVAAWARAWQVREDADLRLALWWDHAGAFHALAELVRHDGSSRPVAAEAEVVARLDRLAIAPESSTSPHGWLLAGNRAMQAADYAAARAAYARALVDLPRHPEVHRNLALALARLGEWDAAAQAMRAAYALAPDDAELRAAYLAIETDAGIAAVQHDDLTGAAEHFLHLLARWPDEPTALANLGNLRRREHRLPEARAIYRRFLAHHPDHPAADTIREALASIEE